MESIMAIGTAIERGSIIYVYSDDGHLLFAKNKGSGPRDGLIGFTQSTVTTQFGSVIYTYDEEGMVLYAKTA